MDDQTAENCNDESSVTDAPDLVRNIRSYNHDAGRVNDDETVDDRTKFSGFKRWMMLGFWSAMKQISDMFGEQNRIWFHLLFGTLWGWW